MIYVKEHNKNTRKENSGEEKFFLHGEVIDSFHSIFCITIIEKSSFHIDHVRIFGSVECGKTRCDYFQDN